MMTDHDTLKPRDDGHEGWKGSVLFIIGAEITPPKNHYIVFGDKKLRNVAKMKTKSPQECIDAVNKQGWLGFIAHPDHTGTSRFDVPAYPWEAWDAKGFTGMGVWDLMTDWLAQLDRDDVNIKLYEEFASFLTGPKAETLERWDKLNQEGKVVGIGEIDNHRAEREFEGNKLQIFPYDVAFRTVTNHVLLDAPLPKDPGEAQAKILAALQNGHSYVSFDFWDDPTEFTFEIDEGDTSASMGEEITLHDTAEVIVSLPDTGLINVLRDGKSVGEVEDNEAVIEINEPGVYRVEVMRNGLTWILSNPIHVKRSS